jgi:hypothetical protein
MLTIVIAILAVIASLLVVAKLFKKHVKVRAFGVAETEMSADLGNEQG